jgi:hypothetical protein
VRDAWSRLGRAAAILGAAVVELYEDPVKWDKLVPRIRDS